ncbi:molybdenum cofactor guanylyltransferase [Gudongella oleilytica]|uniref:molybdenum cofactor guanylyltransferase n=1 Tax=Gudongella oleilytica TaxID=1582259 RepID=UPI002A35AB30|nr:molybdenum cofactor guanylyltransferase [Gudongella oleilytica]MDY0257333.1 molybdenum cofactor guanylyltransferase [Gudongella oleilytica]
MKSFGSAIILAGGKSTRMGFDKQLLRLRERSLIEGLIRRLGGSFHETIVVTNRPELYIGLADKITGDIIPDMGPLSGIHAGLSAASSEYSFVIACDMPQLNTKYIDYMMELLNKNESMACITKFGDWIEPFNAFYSKALIDHIESFLMGGGKAVHRLLMNHNVEYIPEEVARGFSPDWGMFFNLNTREDLLKYTEEGTFVENDE